MLEGNMVDSLIKIGKAETFSKGDYICREGMPGVEMYIVIKGAVGIYIHTILDEDILVEEVQAGGFFGEMSIFDRMPRSASCIALEETICITIRRINLRQLITACPELAEKLMVNLSARLREANDKLYKSDNPDTKIQFVPFDIPPEHRSHSIQEQKGSAYWLTPYPTTCPVCQKPVTLSYVKTDQLTRVTHENPLRRVYRELDVLWHHIWTCPGCGYTNYYLDFHRLPEVSHGEMLRVLTDQNHYFKEHFLTSTPFDNLVFQYFRAIHFNASLNAGNLLLRGQLWLYLSWIYTDAGNREMQAYCEKQALDFYRATYQEKNRLLHSDGAKQQCAMIAAELLYKLKDRESAKTYYYEVVKYTGKAMAQLAYNRIYGM